MTQSKSVVLYCDAVGDDGEPCPESYGDEVMVSNAHRLREMAAGDGWTNDGAKDYCPEHSPEGDT